MPFAAAWGSFAANLAFALWHGVEGLQTHSWWLITLGVYYALLSVMRFCLLRMAAQPDESASDLFIRRFSGAMLIALSVCLAGTVILCMMRERGVRRHEIVMITLALYAFIKLTFGVINLIRAQHSSSAVYLCLRNLAFADALVSICSLQRSMLVSFGGMAANHIVLFNLLTGAGACVIIFLLGLNLIGGQKITMAKSKLVNGIRNIEKSVVDGYKKIEETVVNGYTKIEDKFIDQYLTRDDETVEEARARLKKQTEQL